jgi:hypothetical protein
MWETQLLIYIYKDTYRPITNERENVYSKILLMKSSKNFFNFSPACCLIIWLMISSNFLEKKGILKIWQLVFLWDVKTHFGKLPLKWCIFIHEKKRFSTILPSNSYYSYKMYSLWYLHHVFIILWAIRYSKDIFCFQESIFQWQISLISYRS